MVCYVDSEDWDMFKRFGFFTIFILFGLIQLLFAGAIISSFQGEAGYNRVELKWIVTAENSLKGYQVLRSLDSRDFEPIATVGSKSAESGEKTYSYIDNSVFKPTNHEFYYKLRLVNEDGSYTDYDKVLRLAPQISSARQTWGSIKAMFR
jgi:hypothetical protein